MKLATRCNSCNQEIILPYKAATRGDLQMKEGDEVKAFCPRCGATHKKHLNDIYAEENKMLHLLAVGIGLVLTVILWRFYGVIGGVALGASLLFLREHYNSVRAFNRYRIHRKQ